LPARHQLGHGPDGVLDGHGVVDAVLVVEVDVVDAQSLQRRVARDTHVVRVAVDTDPGAVLPPLVAELGGDHHVVPTVRDRPADQALVGEGPVHVGRVEERAAPVERPVDHRHRLGVVGGAVELGHAHAAEADGGDGEVSKGSLLHHLFLPRPAGLVIRSTAIGRRRQFRGTEVTRWTHTATP